MPFDANWFDELRGLSEAKLQETRVRGIDGYVPHVGELCRGMVTSQVDFWKKRCGLFASC